MVKVSFIVITYQRGELLQQCVNSILTQKNVPSPYELIVVDNGSNAKVHVPIERDDIIFRLEVTPWNLGVGGGRNLGMQLATGDYYIFIDDDALWFDEYGATKIVTIFDQYPDCGAVTGRSLLIQRGLNAFSYPFPDKEFARSLNNITEAPYFYGVVHGLRACVLEQTGDYCARYFYGGEEFDLSLRIIDNNHVILYNPSIIVIHYQSNLGRLFLDREYWLRIAVNKIQVAWRLLPFPYPLTIMSVWLGYTLLKTRNPIVVCQIILQWLKLLPTLLKERQPIQRKIVNYLKHIGGRLVY